MKAVIYYKRKNRIYQSHKIRIVQMRDVNKGTNEEEHELKYKK